MKIFFRVTIFQFLFVLLFSTIADAKQCVGTGAYNDGSYAESAIVTWESAGNGCCSQSSGAALVEYAWFYYDGTEWVSGGNSTYYISISDAQYAAGCMYA